jgi:hypothetical protein
VCVADATQTSSAESWAQDRTGEFVSKTRREARALNKEQGGAAKGDRLIDEEGGGFVPPSEAVGVGFAKKPERTLDLEGLSFQQVYTRACLLTHLLSD